MSGRAWRRPRFGGSRPMRRFLIILCSVCVAGTFAAADMIYSMSALAPQDRGVPGQPSWEERRLLWEVCITFYGTAYATGRLLYRYLGEPGEAAVLRSSMIGYLGFLQLVGGVWLVVAAIVALVQTGVLRPALIIGALLAGAAVWEARDVLGPQLRVEARRILGPHGERALAFFSGLLPLVSCTGLMDFGVPVAYLAGGGTFVAGGMACWYVGRKWPGRSGDDTRSWLRMGTWARIYITVGILVCLLIGGGWLKRMIVG
jgi:hypothetical protein